MKENVTVSQWLTLFFNKYYRINPITTNSPMNSIFYNNNRRRNCWKTERLHTYLHARTYFGVKEKDSRIITNNCFSWKMNERHFISNLNVIS